jgi:uncharacterized protein (DUF2235 family)
MAPPNFVPRNIVVLSDGTGNSSAQLFKTNVWRTYEALDLSCPDQIALYDDGVGTASFAPLAILGGAFGFGLKRNVLDLYTFLCRNYRVDPDDPTVHDRIFAFGFSRGAFTARVVTALVATEGLVQAHDSAELRRLSAWAYRRYRESRYRNSPGVRLLRHLRDGIFRLRDMLFGRAAYDRSKNLDVDIDFLGVWDTVAAYGLPIEELTRGWDRWVWPSLPKDRTPSKRIRRARHALALDDERQTFFPLLWNEADEQHKGNTESTNVDDERISQVWFAGMHSNVGGGYPDDTLAFTSLRWMATEAQKYGVRFAPSLRTNGNLIPDAWIERAVACAPMNDSRRGAGAYYRYHPRPVERLCNDTDFNVTVRRPKIHESVLVRLRDTTDAYACLTLPRHYAVVTSGGEILSGDADAEPPAGAPNPYEHSSQAAAREVHREDAFNFVWARRILYFVTVGVTLFVLLLPLFPDLVDVGTGRHTYLGPLVGTLSAFVPGFADGWLAYYEERPAQLFVGAAIILGLLLWSSALERQMVDRMRKIWRAGGFKAKPIPVPAARSDWRFRLRTSRAYRGTFRLFSHHVWPNVFGVVLLYVIAFALPLRAGFEGVSRWSGLPESDCQLPAERLVGANAPQPARAAGDGDDTFAFWPHRMCSATGLEAVEGDKYRVEIALPPACPALQIPHVGDWHDSRIPVGSVAGFSTMDRLSSRDGAIFVAAFPIRRVTHAPWFATIVAIGMTVPERHIADGATSTFVAGRDGPLSMFVNDAIGPWPVPGWDFFYRNNAGGPARVRITRDTTVAMPADVGVGSSGPQLRAAASPAAALVPYSCDQQQQLAKTIAAPVSASR